MKKIVQRTCIGCKAKKDKKEFLRLVLNKQGEFFIDEGGKAEGRGAYICYDTKCLDNAIKTKKIERTFEKNINKEFYNYIRGVIIERESRKENN